MYRMYTIRSGREGQGPSEYQLITDALYHFAPPTIEGWNRTGNEDGKMHFNLMTAADAESKISIYTPGRSISRTDWLNIPVDRLASHAFYRRILNKEGLRNVSVTQDSYIHLGSNFHPDFMDLHIGYLSEGNTELRYSWDVSVLSTPGGCFGAFPKTEVTVRIPVSDYFIQREGALHVLRYSSKNGNSVDDVTMNSFLEKAQEQCTHIEAIWEEIGLLRKPWDLDAESATLTFSGIIQGLVADDTVLHWI